MWEHVIAACTEDHVDFPDAARKEDEPLAPLRNHGRGAVSLRLLGGIGLRLVRRTPCTTR
jgi:hypothetical protein